MILLQQSFFIASAQRKMSLFEFRLYIANEQETHLVVHLLLFFATLENSAKVKFTILFIF